MPTVERIDPYGAFNYDVEINVKSGIVVKGSFSDVSGLMSEVSYAEYRDGTDKTNAPRKIPNTHKFGDVTLKRGLFGGTDIWKWINAVMKGDPESRADMTIKLYSEDREQVVFTWVLSGTRPSKWTGPTLAAKGGTEVAMEELVCVCESMKVDGVD